MSAARLASGAPPVQRHGSYCSSGFRDLHLLVEIVGDEVAHDLVEILVDLEAEPAGPGAVDALGPAVADLLDRRIVLPRDLADLAVAGVLADRLLELPGSDVDAVQQQRAAGPEGLDRQVVQLHEGID